MDIIAILLKPEFQESEKGDNHDDNIEHSQQQVYFSLTLPS